MGFFILQPKFDCTISFQFPIFAYKLNQYPQYKYTNMLSLHVKNETSQLRAVVLGTAISNGPTPTIEEAYDMGFEDYIYSNAICFIEWPERVEELLPMNCVYVNIRLDGETRVISVTF